MFDAKSTAGLFNNAGIIPRKSGIVQSGFFSERLYDVKTDLSTFNVSRADARKVVAGKFSDRHAEKYEQAIANCRNSFLNEARANTQPSVEEYNVSAISLSPAA